MRAGKSPILPRLLRRCVYLEQNTGSCNTTNNCASLLSQPGIPKLRHTARQKLKFKGKGHEVRPEFFPICLWQEQRDLLGSLL
jgi:hypothetical protein